MKHLKLYGETLYQNLLRGKSDEEDVRRREFMLNALLCGLTAAGCVATFCKFVYRQLGENIYRGNTVRDVAVFTLITGALWWLSRAGRHVLAAYIFVSYLCFAALNLALIWSFELPMVELTCALLVVIAGIILEAWAALSFTIILACCSVVLGEIEAMHHIALNVAWLNQPLEATDSVDYSLMLVGIGLVSWLANLEIDRGLKRTRESKLELAAERDSLEAKILQRTHELEQAQMSRLLELQRFAEFGRLSAHLLHDVANPLTAASLNLDQLDTQQSHAVRQARRNLQQLERYIDAARKQLRTESSPIVFSVQREIKQLLAILQPLAKEAGVTIELQSMPTLKLHGDPVKFNQIIANIVANALDAYQHNAHKQEERRIKITCFQGKKYVRIDIRDWGSGISQEHLPQLFDPFFTTKSASRGIGMGLAIVRQSVLNDFKGHIKVRSSEGTGTTFSIYFRRPSSTMPAKPLTIHPFEAAPRGPAILEPTLARGRA